jgi:GPR1/FUN34/yaaH family
VYDVSAQTTAAPDRVAQTEAQLPGTAPAVATTMADPTPVAFALFAFALAVYGIRFASVSAATVASAPTTVALDYAILVAGIAETVVGVLAVIRGIAYRGYVTTIFGIWLLGFYLLITSGAANKAFTPDALAWYVLVLIVPVALLAVPSVVHRNIAFIIAFAAILVVLLLLGLGYHDLHNAIAAAAKAKTPPDLSSAVNLLKTSAWFAFIAAAAIWWVFARDVYRTTGVLRSNVN